MCKRSGKKVEALLRFKTGDKVKFSLKFLNDDNYKQKAYYSKFKMKILKYGGLYQGLRTYRLKDIVPDTDLQWVYEKDLRLI